MRHYSKVVGNLCWVGLSEGVMKVTGFFGLILLTNYLGTRLLGVYSLIVTVVFLVITVADLGLSVYSTKHVAEHQKRLGWFLRVTFPFKLLAAVLATILAVCILLMFGFAFTQLAWVILIPGIYMLVTINEFFKGLMRGQENMRVLAFVKFAEGIAYFVLIAIVVAGKLPVWCLFGLEFIKQLFILAFFLKHYRVGYVLARRDKTPLASNFVEIIKKSWPFAATSLLLVAYYRLEIIFLGVFRSETEVGLFSSAYSLVLAMTFIPIIVNNALFPRLSNLYVKKNKNDFYKIAFFSIRVVVVLGLTMAVSTTILSSKIIGFVYADEYRAAAIPLSVLIWYEAVLFVNYALGMILNSVNKQKIVARNIFIALVFKIGLIFVAVPRWGYIGASVGALISEILAVALMSYELRWLLASIPLKKVLLFSVRLVALLSLVFLTLFLIIALPLPFVVLVGGVVALLLVILLRIFPEINRRIVKGA